MNASAEPTAGLFTNRSGITAVGEGRDGAGHLRIRLEVCPTGEREQKGSLCQPHLLGCEIDIRLQLIQGMYNKLIAKCSPPKAKDPLLVLPLELGEMILQFLSFIHIV